MKRSMSASRARSSSETSDSARPLASARPVRPILWHPEIGDGEWGHSSRSQGSEATDRRLLSYVVLETGHPQTGRTRKANVTKRQEGGQHHSSPGAAPVVWAGGSGISVNVASVRSSTLAIETAFSSAMRTTFVGSMIPASTRSTYVPFEASRP